MRRVVTACAGARIRGRPAVRVALSAALGVLGGCLLLTRGLGDGGAALGVLAAGGWSLGLLPVHADPGSTGPRRRSGESAALPQPVPPLE